jgi:antitoxin PrlF
MDPSLRWGDGYFDTTMFQSCIDMRNNRNIDFCLALRYVRRQGVTPMPTATMTSKGQFTMPAEVRTRLRLVPGSKIDIVVNAAGETVIRPRTGDIRRLKGIIKYDGPPVSIEDMNEAIGDAIAEDFIRSIS